MKAIFQIGLLLVCGAAAAFAQAAPLRTVKLAPTATIEKPRITLADLLPASAGASLRRSAAAIDLGYAPVIGKQRTFSSARIHESLERLPQHGIEWQVPEQIAVLRQAHDITPDEVVNALTTYLAGSQVKLDHPIDASAILQKSPLTGSSTATLRVLGSMVDANRNQTGFRVQSGAAPPEWVWLSGLLGAPEKTAARPAAKPVAPVIRAGATVTLEVTSTDSRITMPAVCLRNAMVGQVVPVRIPGRSGTVSATVASSVLVRTNSL